MSARKDPSARLVRDYFLSSRAAAAAVGLVLLVASADLVMPWLVKLAVDALVAGAGAGAPGVFRKVALLSGVILAICLLQYFFRFILGRLYNRVVYGGAARLRDDLYGRLQRQPLNSLAERRVGEVLTHLVVDVQTLQEACLDLISEIPFDACILAGLMVAMFALNPALAAIVVLFLAGSIAAAFGLGRRGWRSHRLAMQSTDDLASRIQEGLASARAIALFDGTGRNEDSLRQASSRHAENLARAGSVRAVVTPFLGLAEYIGIVIVLVVGGWSMLHGTLTAGGLVAFLAYMEMSADPLARAARIVPGLQKAFVAASRLGGLLEETDSPPESPDAVRPARVRGDVVVSGLSFRYPGRSRPALAELAFSVRAGESVAVVGPTGSGKSTFLDLLLRLQLPESGRIVIDEWDLGRLSLSSWRSLVGVVPQDTRLLDRTVSENIALGVAAPAAIHAAAEAAGIGDWIESLPHGYATRLGEGGAFLSGGERQRIAVARLFLHDPRLLVLDEPTSSLDADSEAEVRAVLKKLRRGRTCFIVSHRPAVLEDADKVLLLLDGRQLAFGEPERVWLDFPDLRALFPPAWASLRARGPLPRPTARA